MKILSLLGLAAAGLSASAAAQTALRPFPLTPVSTEATLSGLVTEVDQALVATLNELQQVRLQSMILPDGQAVDLDLRRIDVERRKFGYQLNGEPAGDLLAGTELSLWKGSVIGKPESDVMLSFSKYGTRGWVHLGYDVVHLMPRPDADGDWTSGDVIVATESALNAAGNALEGDCSTLAPMTAPKPRALQPKDLDDVYTSSSLQVDTCGLYEAPIAMETDYQFYQRFNNVSAATTYLTTLLSFISDRYELQAKTVLTFPYLQIYSNSNDPWSTPDNGGNSIDMLNEFVAAWAGNIPGDASLGHMMSGAGLGGGVAFLNALCDEGSGFGVSGNIAGQVQFPVVQQPNNWDFMVVAHELGHNFSSPHTHEFCPPLDECPPNQYFGQCQAQQTCTNQGTIMSYCHLCSGGTANITTYFHPETAALMTSASANSCNPIAYEMIVDHPAVLSNTGTTPTSLTVMAGSLSSVSVHYRFNGTGAFASVPMGGQGSGVFSGDLPVGTCGDKVELYYSFDVAGLGSFTCPTDAPTSGVYSAGVGNISQVFADDFEASQGWATASNGVSSGEWERGVPVNDSGWDFDPSADFDGSGSCYLTDNQAGNTDVDGGDVTLISPAMDFSSPASVLSYGYFLRLTEADGTDRLLVEINAGGGWVEVARHDTDGGLDWRNNTISYDEMVAAGVTPNAATQIRFNVNDGDPQSIVEAGIDGVEVSTLTCDEGFGTNYCGPAVANSSGQSAEISGSGSLVVGDNDVTLTASQMPLNMLGLFITSPTAGFLTNPGGSAGNLCLSGQIGRYNGFSGYGAINSGASGSISLVIDLGNHPTPNGNASVMAGETHHFQAWFRDIVGGVPTSNFTDGMTVVLQ